MNVPGTAPPVSGGRLKVLSLTTVFPVPGAPLRGLFVKARLEQLAAYADVKVLAPTPLLNYARWRTRSAALPSRRMTVGNSKLEVLRPKWFYPPFGGAWNALFLFVCLLPVCLALRRRFPFAVIDAHFGHPEGVAAALLAAVLRLPFCVTLRGSELDHVQRGLRRWAMRRSLQRAARVIAVSAPLRELALSLGADAGRTVIIPNGVDRAIFFPRDRTECRRKHGLQTDEKIILSAGHLIQLKGHHRVIQALKRLRAREIKPHLLIAGGTGAASPYTNQLHRLVRELELEGAVSFLGEVPPVMLAELMSAADVFCLASSREGWPNVVQESLSCGTPVVATAVGGVPEQIPSEDYGIVVSLPGAEPLERALRKALDRRWDHDKIAAWGAARSWDEVAREVYEELREVAGEG